MTAEELTAVAAGGDAEIIARLADRAAAREVIHLVPHALAAVILEEGQELHEIDLEEHAPVPDRKRGLVGVDDPDSLVEYVGRHVSTHGTTLWASLRHKRVIAVLDDHEADHVRVEDTAGSDAGWGQHRATLTLQTTPDWDRWTKQDGVWMSQVEFAEHIEDGATSIVTPDPADMLELAQSFQAHNDVAFKSGTRLSSGETKIQYEETVDARAGVRGDMVIPEFIVLKLEPFQGAPDYQLQARFRYRIGNGVLKLSYRLVRPEEAQRLAFADILADIAGRTGLPVLQGTPRT